MNLFEKLNRLDDSLVESKRVVKKKKLTESLQKKQLKENYQISAETWNNIKDYADLETTTGRDFAYDGPYADEVGALYGAAIDQYNESEGTSIEYQASIQNGRGASELFDDQGGYAYRDFETECDELLDFAREATCLEDFMSSLVSYIYSFAEDLEYEEEDYDDDIDEMLTESMSFSWLDVQNQIALEQQEGKNPFYDESVAGDYILELMGKVEKELNVEVVPSVQSGYGDVFIHVGNVLDKSEKIIDPINFNKFSSDMINLVLEADTENEFVDNYRAEILAYID